MSWDTASAEEIIANIRAAKAKIENDHKENLGRWQVMNHIMHKVNVRELKPEIGLKMFRAIEAGAVVDYRTLYLDAVRVPLPETVYHSAPTEFRAQIEAEGLRAALPSDGHWNINASGQPRAVYVAPEPDRAGLWALTDSWDIWEIDTNAFVWQHDQMNEGCWAILHDIPVKKIRLFETRTLANVRAKA